MKIMNREYSWEELADLERDVSEAISDAPIPGEYEGTIRVAIVYIPPYPEGDVPGPCICGSWPGGECLRCEVQAP